jgi:hypothetical protein
VKHEATIALARTLVAHGRHGEVERMLRPVLAAGSAADSVRLSLLLTRVLLLGRADHDDAAAAFQAIASAPMSDSATTAEKLVWQGWLHAWPSTQTFRPGSAVHAFRRAVALATAAGRTSSACWAYLGAGLVYHTLRLNACALQMLDLARQTEWPDVDDEARAWLTGLSTLAALRHDDLASAESHCSDMQQVVSQLDLPIYEARHAAIEARRQIVVHADLDHAAVLANRAVDVLERDMIRGCPTLLEARLCQVDVALGRDRRDHAAEMLNTIEQSLGHLVGAMKRVERRREIIRMPSHIHQLPRRVRQRAEATDTIESRSRDPFWGGMPDLRGSCYSRPVLIVGERGSGRMWTARLLHDTFSSEGSTLIVLDGDTGGLDGPDIRVLSDPQEGIGTIVLRNVDRMPPSMLQRLEKLLPTGESATGTSTMVLATASTTIEECAAEGSFPGRLFEMLAPITIETVPLRRAKHRIEPLAQHFLERFGAEIGVRPGLTHGALDAFLEYEWPGNIKQLRNELHSLVSAVENEPAPVIEAGDLPSHLLATSPPRRSTPILDEVLAATEREVIISVLCRNGGQVASAAEDLGLTRQGLYKKIKRLGIDVSSIQHDVSLQDSH